jgi:hypothetical protein
MPGSEVLKQRRWPATSENLSRAAPVALLCFIARVLGPGGITVVRLDAHVHVVEEWLRLPESRRRHATDAVAFAYRLLRDEPELFDTGKETSHEVVVQWLLPHLNKREVS